MKGGKTRFKKGNTPWNKGKKGIHLSPSSEFKKGVIPYNLLPIGEITIRTDKYGTKRKWIKTKNKWMPLYLYVWTESGRKLKKGFVIHHIDKNALNDTIDNLIMLSRIDHPKVHNRFKK